MLQRGLRDPEHCVDVRLEGVVELLVGDVREVFDGDLLAAVVHEDVEAPELLDRLRDKITAVSRVTEVAGQLHDIRAGLGEDCGDAVGILILFGQVRHGDIRSLARERDRGGGPDSRVRARDESLTTGQSPGATVGLFAKVGFVGELGIQSGLRHLLLFGLDVRVQLRGIGQGVLVS